MKGTNIKTELNQLCAEHLHQTLWSESKPHLNLRETTKILITSGNTPALHKL